MKNCKILFIIYCVLPLMAQPTKNHHIASDTEVASDGSLTEYLLHNWNREGKVVGLSSVILYIRPHAGSELLEFAAGPDFHWKRGYLNTYFGGTRDGRFVTVAFGQINLPKEFRFLGASDPKLAIGNASKQPTVWFRRAWLGRDHFYLRWEDLRVAGYGIPTGKVGLELQTKVHPKLELYSYPNYDYEKHQKGITAGIRFKLR